MIEEFTSIEFANSEIDVNQKWDQSPLCQELYFTTIRGYPCIETPPCCQNGQIEGGG